MKSIYHQVDAFRNRREELLDQPRDELFITAARYGTAALVALYIGLPLYWLVVSSFTPEHQLFDDPAPITTTPTLENYVRIITETPFPTFYMNSVIVAVGTTILVCMLSVFAAYGLTRGTFRGKRNLARLILFAYMFPGILLAIPLYSMFWHMGLLNSYAGLILAHSARALPLGVWIMWLFFQNIPIHYEELAWVEGVSKIRAMIDIVIPLAWRGMIATAILTFAFSWNDFTLAIIIMNDTSMMTFPVGLNRFFEDTHIHWGLMLAGSMMVMVPVFLIVLFFQKYLLYGLSEW